MKMCSQARKSLCDPLFGTVKGMRNARSRLVGWAWQLAYGAAKPSATPQFFLDKGQLAPFLSPEPSAALPSLKQSNAVLVVSAGLLIDDLLNTAAVH